MAPFLSVSRADLCENSPRYMKLVATMYTARAPASPSAAQKFIASPGLRLGSDLGVIQGVVVGPMIHRPE